MSEFPDLPAALHSMEAETALVLGSGLGALSESLDAEEITSYDAVPGLPTSGVPGHPGRFLLSRAAGKPLLIAEGRVHLYEGWTAEQVAAGIRLLAALGIKKVILTNAAGVINPAFRPGEWMLIRDHLNLTGQSPLHGRPHFCDMSHVYTPAWREAFRGQADRLGIPLTEGVYAAVPGPQYETPAEIRMLGLLGADAVGMSTVPEAIQARALGMEVAGFSCLANWAAGLGGDSLHHDDVLEAGQQATGTLSRLLCATLAEVS